MHHLIHSHQLNRRVSTHNNMEAKLRETLTDYLVSETSLQDVISLPDAKKGTGLKSSNNADIPDLPAVIYAALRIQKERQIRQVEANIGSFLEDLNTHVEPSGKSPDSTFERLISLMEAMEESINERTSGMLWEANDISQTLGTQIGSLEDLKLDSAEVDREAVEGALDSLHELQGLVHGKRKGKEAA